MLKLFLVTSAVLIASAHVALSCCGPQQYMGGIRTVFGEAPPYQEPSGTNVVHYGAWDYTNRKYGFLETYPDGYPVQRRIIQDYAKGIEWQIYEEYQDCWGIKTLAAEPTVCIPDNATFTGSIYIGGNGTDSILADVWTKSYYQKGVQSGLQTITVKHKDCLPLSSQFMGTSDELIAEYPTVISSSWFNITVGIPNPDEWFTVPSYCYQQKKNSDKAARPRLIPDLFLKKYRSVS